MLNVVVGGALAILATVVTQVLIHVLTRRRDLLADKREWQKKELLELRDALFTAIESANSAANRCISQGHKEDLETKLLISKALRDLSRVNSLRYSVESEQVRKYVEDLLRPLAALAVVTSGDSAIELGECINRLFDDAYRAIGESVRRLA